jgi:hypothetical protein
MQYNTLMSVPYNFCTDFYCCIPTYLGQPAQEHDRQASLKTVKCLLHSGFELPPQVTVTALHIKRLYIIGSVASRGLGVLPANVEAP